MLVFGVDVPLIEVILLLTIILFVIFIEAIVLVSLMIKQLNKTKQLLETVDRTLQCAKLTKK